MEPIREVPGDAGARPQRQPGPAPAESWSPGQREAARLTTLNAVTAVRDTLAEGLAALQEAEQDLDFQVYLAGLRKVLTAGAMAKVIADNLIKLYGPEAQSL